MFLDLSCLHGALKVGLIDPLPPCNHQSSMLHLSGDIAASIPEASMVMGGQGTGPSLGLPTLRLGYRRGQGAEQLAYDR